MQSLGATIVDMDTGDAFAYSNDEFTALLFEFKAQIAQYLATLMHTDMSTLADLSRLTPRTAPKSWFITARTSSKRLRRPVAI
jgi:hypothetical protein